MNGIYTLFKPKSNYLISLVNSKIPKSIKEIVYGLTLIFRLVVAFCLQDLSQVYICLE